MLTAQRSIESAGYVILLAIEMITTNSYVIIDSSLKAE